MVRNPHIEGQVFRSHSLHILHNIRKAGKIFGQILVILYTRSSGSLALMIKWVKAPTPCTS